MRFEVFSMRTGVFYGVKRVIQIIPGKLLHFSYGDELDFYFLSVNARQVVLGNQHPLESELFGLTDTLFDAVDRTDFA